MVIDDKVHLSKWDAVIDEMTVANLSSRYNHPLYYCSRCFCLYSYRTALR